MKLIRAILGLDKPTGKFVALLHELFVVLVFCEFTAILTWPYVTRLRDVVVDPGDPYLVAWIFWWDYHQTFTSPLHLFDANTFYPLRYTLAFSEHGYGIALLFFPLYALGFKPLTVHAVIMFFGFVLSGYGAFRLARTLTGSEAVGWVSGIIFAFVPYRFHLMSQAVYLFSPWIPLVFEALVLFVRERSRARAVWLGVAFFMSGLASVSWFTFTLIPFALYAAILLTRYDLWRERAFWKRGAVALGAASLLLLPFMLPYVLASRLYGFKRSVDEIKANSAWPIHWLSVENRNHLWNKMGESIPEGWRFKLFPGLLPILFSIAALALPGVVAKPTNPVLAGSEGLSRERWITRLDILIVFALAISILAIGLDGTDAFHKLFDRYLRSERALMVLTAALIARLCLAYPRFMTTARANLLDTLRSRNRDDAFWLGILLTVMGFCFSLGWNFFLFRICYALLPMFRSMRVVSRGAMLAYLGLALLAGLGVKSLSERLRSRYPRLRTGVVYAAACGLLLFEMNAAPLQIMRGEVNPDAVTLRLKQTPMRGGIVVLPAGGNYNHRYMLRAADHQKPLIVGTSGFNSPIEDRIETLTYGGAIPSELMTLFESVPTSYVVVVNHSILPERTADYELFLATAVAAGRLRFVNRFDGRDDLYAVVKNEPQARSEAALPFKTAYRDWSGTIHDDPVSLLSQPLKWSQELYRVYLATSGAMPRYGEFMRDLEKIGRGIIAGSEAQESQFASNFHEFLEEWTKREAFTKRYGHLDHTQYVDRILENAGINLDQAGREGLVSGLSGGRETRAGVLLKIVDDPTFAEKEKYRSLVLLHYFGYLRRNPGDPPDGDLRGFNFWLEDAERHHNPAKLSAAFRLTGEYHQFEKKP